MTLFIEAYALGSSHTILFNKYTVDPINYVVRAEQNVAAIGIKCRLLVFLRKLLIIFFF